ncbi:MAG: hypothetical protein WA138_08685 [Parvibaculum sp.]
MSDIKFLLGLAFLAGSALTTLACYLKAPGAGIAIGILFIIVIISFLYDNSRQIFGKSKDAERPDADKIKAAAMKHTRMTAMVEDGDLKLAK